MYKKSDFILLDNCIVIYLFRNRDLESIHYSSTMDSGTLENLREAKTQVTIRTWNL